MLATFVVKQLYLDMYSANFDYFTHILRVLFKDLVVLIFDRLIR